jgi:predicted phage terminase large subunit-like protein
MSVERKIIKTLVSKYFKNKKGEYYDITDGQCDIFKAVTDPIYKWVWLSAPTRYGKLIADNTPVLTTKGWKEHGKLVVGDYVFNHKGKQVMVKGIAPKAIADIKISFSNGEKIKINKDHKWLVQHRKWKDWRVVDTKWLMEQRLVWGDGKKVFRLPKIKPLEFKKQKLPIDPYTFGVWLGDGVTTSPSITIKPEDKVIIDNIPYKVSKKHRHKTTGVVRYDFYKTNFIKDLKKAGVLTRISGGDYKGIGKKFIPEIYKKSSIKQKLELLAGLIDTDGYVHKQYRENGDRDARVKIINSNKQLIDDCAEIIRSLGFRVNITKVKAHTSSSGINGKKDIYYLGFDAELPIPTKLPRKKVHYKIKNKYIFITKIEKVKSEQGNCIKINSDDGIYLVGKKLIPTHNTETLSIACLYLAVFHNLKIPIVAGSEEKARKIMEYVVEHVSDHPDLYANLINADIKNIDRLKVTMSKQALRWSSGGWIYVTSIDSRNISKEGEGVVGEGGDVVVLEEAGLIKRKEQFSKVVRMPEEDGGWGKLVMSGNCIENSIFEDAYNNSLYFKVKVGLEQAIKEGRFTEPYLAEKKTQTTTKDWKRYYEVKFPEANEFTYFKPSKYQVLPRQLEYYGSLDPSLGETKKSSKSGIIIIGVDISGQLYEVDSIIEQLTPDEALRTIFNLPYKFNRFVFEQVMFQKYFMQVADKISKEKGLYIPFEGIKQSKSKLERIESLEPHINTGHILFKGDNQLWSDMQDYPETEFLDGLDALEMVYRTITESKTEFAFA